MFYTKSKQNKTIYSKDIEKVIDYLNHAFYCIDYNVDHSISSEADQQFIFHLALNLSPDILIGKVFFPHERLSQHRNRRFYQINQIGCSTMVSSSISISGRTFQIKKIFIFEDEWLDKYYLEPMMRLHQQHQQRQSKRTCLII